LVRFVILLKVALPFFESFGIERVAPLLLLLMLDEAGCTLMVSVDRRKPHKSSSSSSVFSAVSDREVARGCICGVVVAESELLTGVSVLL